MVPVGRVAVGDVRVTPRRWRRVVVVNMGAVAVDVGFLSVCVPREVDMGLVLVREIRFVQVTVRRI
jgi:hypothetical protein